MCVCICVCIYKYTYIYTVCSLYIPIPTGISIFGESGRLLQPWNSSTTHCSEIIQGTTLPETKIGPENGWLEDATSFWDGLFLGAFAVSFREGPSPIDSRTLLQVCWYQIFKTHTTRNPTFGLVPLPFCWTQKVTLILQLRNYPRMLRYHECSQNRSPVSFQPLEMIFVLLETIIFRLYGTLSPIIMEVENYPKWQETNIREKPVFHHFPLPWLWEEG